MGFFFSWECFFFNPSNETPVFFCVFWFFLFLFGARTQILEERTKELLSKKQRHLSTMETRQFDYRPVGEKNPLFGRLGEKDRR